MPGAKRERRFTWVHAILIAGILAALIGIGIAVAPYVTRSNLERMAGGAGAWGPFILLGLQVAQILIAPIPGVLVPIVCGILYGPILGTVIATVGTLLGSAAAYAIGRRAGLPLLRRWVGEAAIARAQALVGGKRWIALALLFLLPFSPSDAICFVAGMIGIRTKMFAPAVLVGRVPKDAALALAGAGLIRLGGLFSGHP